MAKFFGFFDVTKEGPGIEKDAPKKKTIVIFFETFFRNIWKLMSVNAVFIIMSLFILPVGLANVGITHVTRNLARDKHSFMLADYFETIKKNWKQGLVVGIINTVVYAALVFAVSFYWQGEGVGTTIGLGVCISGFIIFSIMRFYIYTLMITFKFKIKQLYANSFKFVFLCPKNNIICCLSLLLVYGINIAIFWLLPTWQTLIIEFFIAFLTLPGFRYLLIQFAAFPGIKKFIIDPYYKEHPGEDIEKRRDLGLEIEEEDDEDEEEDEEENEEEADDEASLWKRMREISNREEKTDEVLKKDTQPDTEKDDDASEEE